MGTSTDVPHELDSSLLVVGFHKRVRDRLGAVGRAEGDQERAADDGKAERPAGFVAVVVCCVWVGMAGQCQSVSRHLAMVGREQGRQAGRQAGALLSPVFTHLASSP